MLVLNRDAGRQSLPYPFNLMEVRNGEGVSGARHGTACRRVVLKEEQTRNGI